MQLFFKSTPSHLYFGNKSHIFVWHTEQIAPDESRHLGNSVLAIPHDFFIQFLLFFFFYYSNFSPQRN